MTGILLRGLGRRASLAFCGSSRHPESPTHKKFVFLEFLNTIAHPATGEISKIEGREATVRRVKAGLHVEPQQAII